LPRPLLKVGKPIDKSTAANSDHRRAGTMLPHALQRSPAHAKEFGRLSIFK